MNEQFIDRVINILVEMKIGGKTPHKLKRGRVAARRAEGIPPPMSRQERETFNIATGAKEAPPSKITRAMNKTLGVDEARGDTIRKYVPKFKAPKRAKPVEGEPGTPEYEGGNEDRLKRAIVFHGLSQAGKAEQRRKAGLKIT